MTTTMARKRTTEPGKDRHKARVLIGIPEQLFAAIDKLVEERLTDRTTEVVRLVRESLELAGLWPPKPDNKGG